MEDDTPAPSTVAVAKPLIASLQPGEFPHVGAAHRPANQEQPQVNFAFERLSIERVPVAISVRYGSSDPMKHFLLLAGTALSIDYFTHWSPGGR